MKSRLFVLLAAVLLTVSATNLYAQEKGSDANNGQVTLNIKLHQIQSLVVNHGTVDLHYTTKEHYTEGVREIKADHLTVFSTGGFKVIASTSTDLINGDNSIESSDIKLVASVGSENKLDAEVAKTIESLTSGTLNNALIESSKGGRDLKFSVEYAAKGNDKYINKYVKDENPTVYTTQITYTIAPQ